MNRPVHLTPRPLTRACRALCTGLALLAATATVTAQDTAISDDVVRLGILTDLNGPFAEIVFDIRLTALIDGVDNQVNELRKRAAA